MFILDNILGTPAPPPPGNVPLLEEAEKEFKDREPTLREVLELHRSKPLCSACHSRVDPLGLALESFNALGRGLELYDVETVDQIVERLDQEQGRFSALLTGIIESAPFQKRRNVSGAIAQDGRDNHQ